MWVSESRFEGVVVRDLWHVRRVRRGVWRGPGDVLDRTPRVSDLPSAGDPSRQRKRDPEVHGVVPPRRKRDAQTREVPKTRFRMGTPSRVLIDRDSTRERRVRRRGTLGKWLVPLNYGRVSGVPVSDEDSRGWDYLLLLRTVNAS